jgi:hypothetical protein
MSRAPVYEFHLSRAARERCRFDGMLFAQTGRLVLDDPAAARRLAAALTAARGGAPAASAADLYAMGLLDEAMHLAAARFREDRDPRALLDVLPWLAGRLGGDALDRTLLHFCAEFPPLAVHRGARSAREWLEDETGGIPHRAVALEELILLWLGNANPARAPYRELFDDRPLAAATAYGPLIALLPEYFASRPRLGPRQITLLDFLREPLLASPDSLFGQLDFVRAEWAWLLGDMLRRVLVALDVLREETRWFEAREEARRRPERRPFGGDSGPGAVPRYRLEDAEVERFSPDEDWMPRVVLLAKSTYVWLDQLAGQYGRPVARLDEIPDEELDRLADFGITGLWLIGLWERSRASRRIKELTGNPAAAASAYSLSDYAIAADLGGEEAWRRLRDRAAARGIRLASDMVPNHMGLDSPWVLEHPEWFLSLPSSPYPAYTFHGPDLSADARVELKIEDHYYDRSDAAVVFRRVDRASGAARFIYHGNDGTSFPWNDTAQLDYLNPATREQVIRTILDVARRFPIIRFDAAMTLARRHVHRLWYPEPGAGGAIPSRAEHGMSAEEFARAMPQEFWREVVDRVAAEAPGTLLLAEAFWLMEGYFVRTLGMHRVYNSAFMNMLRDEQNAHYRSAIRNTVEFDPEILQRYVNFMSNPDEKTAVEQFGRGEKSFGICTLMATLPGLPMLGHGQIEGFEEQYGMEFRHARRAESPDHGLVAEHWRRISPLLRRRHLFAGAHHFRLYDCLADGGGVNEDVFAFSNRAGGERALVLYHNRYGEARGWIRISATFAEKRADGSRPLRQAPLAESLGLDTDPHAAPFVRCRDLVGGQEFLFRVADLVARGLRVELGAYGSRVFLDWREVPADGRPWGPMCDALGGHGTADLDDRLLDHELGPVQQALAAVVEPLLLALAPRATSTTPVAAGATPTTPAAGEPSTARLRAEFERSVLALIARAREFARSPGASFAGLGPADGGIGDAPAAATGAGEAFIALLRVPTLAAGHPIAGSADARAALPLARPDPATAGRRDTTPWAMAAIWIAARALGLAAGPPDPCAAATRLFDALRLRGAAHDALARLGLGRSDEERWRAAALVRAALAHAAWRPGGDPGATPPWRDDADARWLIGTHESGGVGWFRREDHARFVWWQALPALLLAAAPATPSAPALDAIEAWVASELGAAEAAGWRLDALLNRAGQPSLPSRARSARPANARDEEAG